MFGNGRILGLMTSKESGCCGVDHGMVIITSCTVPFVRGSSRMILVIFLVFVFALLALERKTWQVFLCLLARLD